jgi:hypothetical protein
MPKHLPHVNGWFFVTSDILDQARVRDLAKRHQIADDYDLYDALTNAASSYSFMVATKGQRLTHADHKAYLQEIGKRAKALEDALKGMNAQLAYELHHAWPHPDSKDGWRSRMEDDTGNLARAADEAVQAMPDSKGGAPANVAFHRLLDMLIEIYEESTKKQVGYRHEELWYDDDEAYYDPDEESYSAGESAFEKNPYRGPFIEFASEALVIIGVKKTNTALGKALERKLRKRRAGL